MLRVVLHRLILTVTLIAFAGGMTLQLMPPKAAFAASKTAPVTGDCADMAMPPPDASHGNTPCKGIDTECIKQLRCLGTPSLPLRPGDKFVHFAYGKVVYWTPAIFRDGRSIKPDLFPPIGL